GFIIGEEIIKRKIETGQSNVIGATLLSGVITALKTLQAHKIVIGTAHTSNINKLERRHFENAGFEVLNIHGLRLITSSELDNPDADVIFLSCGALWSVEVIQAIESRLGKPVITSNQASLWNCLGLAGIDD